MLTATLAIVFAPMIIGYIFSLKEDASNHKHFMRVTNSQ